MPSALPGGWCTSRWAGSPSPRRWPTRCCSWPPTSRASSRRAPSWSTAASRAPTSRPCEVFMRPLIGLTTYREQAQWGVWDQPADLLPVTYADAIVRAGGVPVLLPPASEDPDAAVATVARIDGLVVSGGADVDP